MTPQEILVAGYRDELSKLAGLPRYLVDQIARRRLPSHMGQWGRLEAHAQGRVAARSFAAARSASGAAGDALERANAHLGNADQLQRSGGVMSRFRRALGIGPHPEAGALQQAREELEFAKTMRLGAKNHLDTAELHVELGRKAKKL